MAVQSYEGPKSLAVPVPDIIVQHEELKARAVLKELEWVWDSDQGCWFCPACSKAKDNGHTPDCRLAKVIGQ